MNNATENLFLIAHDILSIQQHERRNITIVMSLPLYNRLFGGFSYDSYERLFGVPLEVVNDSGYWWVVGVRNYAHLQEDTKTDE